MSGRLFLGIDQGTTGTTVLLLDEGWNVLACSYRKHTQIYPRPGWVEHDPLEIWNAVLAAVDAALKEAGAESRDIACIGLANQGETCMIWDKHTGEPVYNLIVWQDRRTSEFIDRLSAEMGDTIREKTGLVPDAYFSASKLKWILENVPGVSERARSGKLAAGTVDTWLIWKLTRGKAFVTDYSTASRTMLFNIRSGKWDDEILETLGIPRGILPEICESAAVYSCTDPLEFFGASVPISGSIVDQQAALFGQACHIPGSVKTTYGTGCFMLMNTGHEAVYSKNGLLTTVAWGLNGEMTFALDGGIYVAGAAIQWLRDKLQIIPDSALTEEMAVAAGDNGGTYFVPAFTGLAAPYWDQYARGTIVGLNFDTSREHIVRAALESVAYQVKDLADLMSKDSAIPIQIMRVDGGMTANKFLMQFQTDILGIPVDVPEITEMTALGAAYLAACGIGEFKSLDDAASKWRLACRFEPKMSADERESLMYNWHRAVEQSRKWEKSNS